MTDLPGASAADGRPETRPEMLSVGGRPQDPRPDEPRPDQPFAVGSASEGPGRDSPGPEEIRFPGLRDWPRAARWSAYAAVAVVLLLVAGLLTGVVLVRRPFPETSGELELPGLVGEVEVVRDEAGIPQLYADSTADLMRAQGYVHAQERFYEMDVRRHLTSGRLSELFGATSLDADRLVRTLGWRRVARQELALLAPETRTALQDYADGVNAYLDSHGVTEIAVEYSVLAATGLDYRPEPWTPVDSLAWLKAMAWDVRGNMTEEIQRALLSADLPPERVAQLFPPYDYGRHRPIVAGGAVVGGVFRQADAAGGSVPAAAGRPAYTSGQRRLLVDVRDRVAAMPALVGEGEGLGSNSWVVDGAHSATGAPLLANDPHLGVSLPGIWMQMGLHCRTVTEDCPFDVAGFTFSGVPGVVIGHNADIAWGFTNLGPDVTDLYVERVRGRSWRYDGQWRPLRVRTETIRVRDGDDVRLRIRETAHGPLLSEASEEVAAVSRAAAVPPWAGRVEPGERFAVSLAWTALRPSRTADALLALDRASTWREFRQAATRFAVPAQNLLYADRRGHIGYQAPGLIPIRRTGNDGSVPSAGWRPENDWTGEYVPFRALPAVRDPAQGFLVTANQAVAGPGYPFELTVDWDHGYRAERIRELIEAEGELSIEEMTDLQLDDWNPLAAVLVPYLTDLRLPRGYYSEGLRLLETWDHTEPADSAAAAYFNVVWRTLLALTFHDELDEDVWPKGGERWFAVMEHLLRRPADDWWDDQATEARETRDDILRQALLDGRDEITRLLARDPDDWRWGDLHRLDLRNATLGRSGAAPVEWLLNRGGYRVGGGSAVVNATGWDASIGYQVTSAPTMRMVVSLGDLDRSRWVSMTGVSGHPFHPHYVDQTRLWVDGETLPWPFRPAAVADAAESTLTLVPAARAP